MLPEEVRLEINEGKEITLVPGLHRIKAECLDRLQPDAVIVFDTHWESTFEHIVTSHERRQGKFTSHELPRGMKQIPYDMPGDPELANLIAAQAEGRDDCWILANDDPYLPLFYGTVNIWTFLGDPKTGLAERGAEPVLRHGRLPAVRRADRQGDRAERSAGCVAGVRRDDAPLLQLQGSAQAREPEGPRQHLRSRVLRRRHGRAREVRQGGPRRRDRRHARVPQGLPRGPLRPLPDDGRGARWKDCTATGELFSEYEASVGTGQVHVWFERPEGGWTA
jgi:hypothetical protein